MMQNDTPTTRGRAFRRIGAGALTAGAAVGVAACLFGVLPAQAAVTPHATGTAHVSATGSATAAPKPAATPGALTPAQKIDQLREQLRKAAEDDPVTKQANAYYGAGYTYEDALDLAAVWNSADRIQAKSKAGAALLQGHSLPFAPGKGFDRTYTEAQELHAFDIAEVNDPQLATRLAASWKVSVHDAKVKAGGLALANKTVPLQDPTPSEGDAAEAFFGAGYDYADAVRLAGIWKVDPYSAKVKAGRDLLSTPKIALPFAP